MVSHPHGDCSKAAGQLPQTTRATHPAGKRSCRGIVNWLGVKRELRSSVTGLRHGMDRIGAVLVELVVPLDTCASYDERHCALGAGGIVYLYSDSLVRNSGTG